jgi:hypothetical protein
VRRFADATCVEELLIDGEVLFREITTRGFRGSVKTVRRFLQPFRSGQPNAGVDASCDQGPPGDELDRHRPGQPQTRTP